MINSAKQSISPRKGRMDCFVAEFIIGPAEGGTRWLLAMTESAEMLTKTPHLFDDATQVTAGDSRWQGKTSEDYWAFVGPFGGATAATILRALIDHPQRAGDPLALTVNFCAPIAQGAFDLDVRLVKANRSTQHWCVELTPMYGPAVRCKRFRQPGRCGLASMYPASDWSVLCSGPSWISARVRSD